VKRSEQPFQLFLPALLGFAGGLAVVSLVDPGWSNVAVATVLAVSGVVVSLRMGASRGRRADDAATAEIVGRIGGMRDAMTKSQAMAGDVAAITTQTTLLALDAAIDAARRASPARDRVAASADEACALSLQSSEASARIAQTMHAMNTGIAGLCVAAAGPAPAPRETRNVDVAAIGEVLGNMRGVMDSLAASAERRARSGTGPLDQETRALARLHERVGEIAVRLVRDIERVPGFHAVRRDGQDSGATPRPCAEPARAASEAVMQSGAPDDATASS
jgi:hypothetical protein